MNRNEDHTSPDLVAALCHELNILAKRQEDAAADAAARTPYWVACPPSVEAHRTAARLLRADADRLESETRLWSVAS
jgi:hypothetical protein